jgi:hypothetical protein
VRSNDPTHSCAPSLFYYNTNLPKSAVFLHLHRFNLQLFVTNLSFNRDWLNAIRAK